MQYSTETLSLYIFICLKMFLTAMIRDEHAICFTWAPLLCYVITWRQTLPAIEVETQLYACHLHRKFALFCMPYYLRHDIENFSDYLLLLDLTVLVWKLKNINNAKCRQIDFFSLTFKPEVRSSSEVFGITKWTNQVLFCWAILFNYNNLSTSY